MKKTDALYERYLPPDNFYAEVKRRIKASAKTGAGLSIMSLDLDRFNYINDLFGYELGDQVLAHMSAHFSACLQEDEVFTRIHADIFAFCLGHTDHADVAKRFAAFTAWNEDLLHILPPHYSLTASSGVVVVQDDTLPVSALLDKANYARQKAKGSVVSCFRYYDVKMEEELGWQKIVTLSMESALENREFEMYLQPKVLIKNDEIVGAEALVRWNSPRYGMVVPDRFIPIMEQNGFVRQLDFFMLEEACRFLKESEATGLPMVPISVNFSKTHLNTDNLAERIFYTVNRLNVPAGLIEIEFTESLAVEGFERLIEVVTDLKLLGFRVSLDDFGSAYSSLNCLKELPIDIIKIDKGFLDSSADTEKGRLIVSKVVELIKSLRMFSVMEGVETGEQVEFLRKLSCDFGQGYFFAKPMPVAAYVEYLKKGSLSADLQSYLAKQTELQDKSYLHGIPQEFQMDNWELYTLGKNIDMGLMKGYLDGEATVQYVNDRALEYLGYSRQEFREVFRNSIIAFIHPDDAPHIVENTEQLILTGKPVPFNTRAIRKDGKVIMLQGRASCVMDDKGRPIGIYAFQDVTEELERTAVLECAVREKIKELEATVAAERVVEQALRLSEERYRAIVELSDDVMFDWDFATDTVWFSDKFNAMFGMEPVGGCFSANPAVDAVIHPDDLPEFKRWIAETHKNPGRTMAEFRHLNAEGNYIWLRCHVTGICDETGNALRAVGLFSNINSMKNRLDALTLKSQRDPLTQLLNKEETRLQTGTALLMGHGQPGAFFMMDIDNFKGLNDNLGHQLGDTVLVEFARKISAFFPEGSIVGRIGGDEMAAYVPGLCGGAVQRRAAELLRAVRLDYYGPAAKYNVTASVGIACYPDQGKDFDTLYRLADIALYESKRGGKDRYTVYQAHMEGVAEDTVRTPMDWQDGFLNTYFQCDFPFQIFEMLYETKDMHASVHMILELLGRRFSVDRVYIFQQDPDGVSVSNTHEWCGPDISSEQMSLQHITYESLGPYLSRYSSDGIFCCPDIRKADREIYDICAPQGIKSILHCAIYNEGEMAGFIGFDMCTQYQDWSGEAIAILGYISRILSVFLLKTDAALELRTSYRNYVEMLDNLNGYVYVVDPESYEVLYINKAVRSLGLVGGQPCYKMTFRADEPCANCPMKQFSDTVHYATTEIYSTTIKRWVSSAASKLRWEGNKEAVLVCCNDISKYKNDPPPDHT